MQKTYYQILQVDPNADPEVITAAYKRLSLKYHPDTNRSSDANLRMQEINEAYQALNDPAQRASYDRYLTGIQMASSDSAGNGSPRASANSSPFFRSSQQATRISRPQQALASTVASLSFPLTYLLLIFILFRLFRSPSMLISLAVMIFAGVIAYKVSARIEGFFRKF